MFFRQRPNQRSARAAAALLNALALAAAFALGGCFSSDGNRVVNQVSDPSKSTLKPGETPAPDETLKLNAAIRSKYAPGELADLVGSGNGAIGAACGTGGSNASPQLASCICSFRYTRLNTAVEAVESTAVYSEGDLLRCSYTMIPSDATQVSVRLRVVASGKNKERWSNEASFDATSSEGLDPTSMESFLAPKRHLCREIVSVKTPFGLGAPSSHGVSEEVSSAMYDPVLSEDPAIAVTFNFYASNMGYALAQHAFRNKGWDCTGDPFMSPYGSPWGTYSVYSQSGDKIHDNDLPISNARNRFLLAKAPVGAFLTRIEAMVAPKLLDTIGYGAKAVPTGSNTEACPSTAQKPPGTRWVKLWLFRGDLKTRDIPYNTTAMNTNVACVPPGAGPGNMDIAGCSASAGNGSSPTWLVQIGSNNAGCSALPALPDSETRFVAENAIRYDFIYVVTPDSIMTRDFLNGGANVSKYIPVRKLRLDSDSCEPGDAGCKSLVYSPKFGEVAQFGDSESGPVGYPVCVLQEDNLR